MKPETKPAIEVPAPQPAVEVPPPPPPDPAPVTGANDVTKQAGLIVTVLTGVTIVLALAVVSYQIWLAYKDTVPFATARELTELCRGTTCSEAFLRLMLEQDAQLLRTERVRAAISSRLLIFTLCEIVGLTLAVLGAVLIFDRVHAQTDNRLTIKDVSLVSAWPGLIMCGVGAAVTCYAVGLSISSEGRLTVYDLPVHTQDLNFGRNYVAGNVPSNVPGDRTNPFRPVSANPTDEVFVVPGSSALVPSDAPVDRTNRFHPVSADAGSNVLMGSPMSAEVSEDVPGVSTPEQLR